MCVKDIVLKFWLKFMVMFVCCGSSVMMLLCSVVFVIILCYWLFVLWLMWEYLSRLFSSWFMWLIWLCKSFRFLWFLLLSWLVRFFFSQLDVLLMICKGVFRLCEVIKVNLFSFWLDCVSVLISCFCLVLVVLCLEMLWILLV